MTDMTAVSAVSDTPPERTPSAIEAVATVSARHLSRNMAATLRAVADEGHSFAVKHFGRVVGFLIPTEGRVAVRRGPQVVYEVPEPEALLELNEVESSIVRTLYREGRSVPDRLMGDRTFSETARALAALECSDPPLIRKTWMGYELTPAGVRHAEELGS